LLLRGGHAEGLLGAIGEGVGELRRVDPTSSFDTTSVNLCGDYLGAQEEAAPCKITQGYSKDKRPDLKQFVLSLLCVDGNVPVFGKIEDGNASDKAINHRLLSEISEHMQQYGVEAAAFVYIADLAMVTDANLAQLGERTRFISRLPATYNEHERVILAAIEADDWQAIGHIAQTAPTKNRPGAFYRLHEGSVTIDGKAYRAVVVHSSAHDRRRLKRLERELEASRTESVRLAKEAEKQTFLCRSDAEAAAAQGHTLSTAYHLLDVSVEERPRFAPGRPKKGAPRLPVAVDYVLRTCITEQPEAIAKRRQMAGCFVLLSNVAASQQRHHQSSDQHPDDRQPRRLLRLVERIEQSAQFTDVLRRIGSIEPHPVQGMPRPGLGGALEQFLEVIARHGDHALIDAGRVHVLSSREQKPVAWAASMVQKSRAVRSRCRGSGRLCCRPTAAPHAR